jgi:peptidoglycan/LPS O-acetylase OafA/YrhL
MGAIQGTSKVPLSSVHLDAARGLAALIVLVGHNRDLYFSPVLSKQVQNAQEIPSPNQTVRSPSTPGQITMGNEAVMIFFVLSGYLVGGAVLRALRRDTWSWADYLIKRLTRLYVVLIPGLIFGVALDFLGLHLHPSPDSLYAGPAGQTLVHDVASKLTFPVIAGNLVFLQHARVPTAGTNDSLWSLTNEFWYYILFPAVLLLFKANQRLWHRLLYSALILGVCLLVGKDILLLFLPWLLGALIATLPIKIPDRISKILLIAVLLVLPVFCANVRKLPWPVFVVQWMVALYFAPLLYLMLHRTKPAADSIYRRCASFLSRTSYTSYLVHMPLAVFICALINNPWHREGKSLNNLAVFGATNLALIAFAYLFYLAFEANTDLVRQRISSWCTVRDEVRPKTLA